MWHSLPRVWGLRQVAVLQLPASPLREPGGRLNPQFCWWELAFPLWLGKGQTRWKNTPKYSSHHRRAVSVAHYLLFWATGRYRLCDTLLQGEILHNCEDWGLEEIMCFDDYKIWWPHDGSHDTVHQERVDFLDNNPRKPHPLWPCHRGCCRIPSQSVCTLLKSLRGGIRCKCYVSIFGSQEKDWICIWYSM